MQRRIIILAAFALLAVLLTGCFGGSGIKQSYKTTGELVVSIDVPQVSPQNMDLRLRSVKVGIKSGKETLSQEALIQGGSASVAFDGLKPGLWHVVFRGGRSW
ncbi:MAG: hypothetical protein GX205_07475 [Firmicutes bacterium]|nr:hypothetical protein [Bacillota bacterium]